MSEEKKAATSETEMPKETQAPSPSQAPANEKPTTYRIRDWASI